MATTPHPVLEPVSIDSLRPTQITLQNKCAFALPTTLSRATYCCRLGGGEMEGKITLELDRADAETLVDSLRHRSRNLGIYSESSTSQKI